MATGDKSKWKTYHCSSEPYKLFIEDNGVFETIDLKTNGVAFSNSTADYIKLQDPGDSWFTEEEIERIADKASDYAIVSIQINYDLKEVISNRQWMSQIITDFVIEYIDEYISEYLKTEVFYVELYKLTSFDTETYVNMICSAVNWNYIYDTLEEYSNQPVTMYEKLRDIGMNESDFL